MIEEKLGILQKQLEIKLEEIREIHKHKGNKGSNVEQSLRDFLKEFLPPYNRIGEGEIIDTEDKYSTQIDIVVTNEHQPYLNDLGKPSIFFIEGIACAGEVKSILNSQDLEKILNNSLKYKELKVTVPTGSMICINDSDRLRFIEKRPYFLFAFESQITLTYITEKIIIFNKEKKLSINQQIDAVFILDKGVIINFGDGKGSFRFITNLGESKPGIVQIPKENDDKILLNFLSWISMSTPKFSTFSSILTPYLMKGRMK